MTDTQQPARGTTVASPVHHGHGNSIAAWTAVGVIIFGGLVLALAVALASWPVAVVGVVICAAGAASGKVLATMGFGVDGRAGH